jgi:hypothetical protein
MTTENWRNNKYATSANPRCRVGGTVGADVKKMQNYNMDKTDAVMSIFVSPVGGPSRPSP